MIDRIEAMRTFVRIVDMNSFTRASESLGIARARTTTIVQHLEALLGVPLLLRTTRRLTLTAEGMQYHDRCVRILADIDEAESALSNRSESLRGRLRIEMPGAIAHAVVLPSIVDFHARHPHIELTVGVSSRTVDLISDGVDCSIQLGNLPNSGLIARRLGDIERVTCASPAYLRQRGVPRTPDDLSRHVGIKCAASSNGYCMGFDFHAAGKLAKVKLDGFLQIDDEHGCLLAGIEGVGLLQPSRLAAEPYLRSGQLREVLPAWRPVPSPVSLVYLAGRQMSSPLRALVDWLSERFDENRRVEAVAHCVQRKITAVSGGGPGRSMAALTSEPL